MRYGSSPFYVVSKKTLKNKHNFCLYISIFLYDPCMTPYFQDDRFMTSLFSIFC